MGVQLNTLMDVPNNNNSTNTTVQPITRELIEAEETMQVLFFPPTSSQ